MTIRRCPSFSDRPSFPSGLRVLIIDNNVPHLNSSKQLLQSCDYVVTTCSSRADSLRVLRADNNVFDVVLVDLVMVTEGKDANKVIQAIHNRGLPVVTITDSDKTDLVMKGIRLGAAQVLRKPLAEFQVKKLWYHAVRKEAKKQTPLSVKGTTSSSSISELTVKPLKGIKPGGVKWATNSQGNLKQEKPADKTSDGVDSIMERDFHLIHEEVRSLYSQDMSVEGFDMGGAFCNVLGKENDGGLVDDCVGSGKSSSCSEVGLEMDRCGSVESNGNFALNTMDGNGQRRLAVRPCIGNQYGDSYGQQGGNNQMWQYPINQQNRYKSVVSVPAQQDPWGAPILPSMAAHCQALGGRSEQTSMGNSLLAESYPPPRAIPSLGCVKDIAKKQTLGLCLEKSTKLAQAITKCLAKEAKDRKH